MHKWILGHQVFVDIYMTTPSMSVFLASNPSATLAVTFCKHETEKHHADEERVHEVERGSFTPLVFSTSGGMGKQPPLLTYTLPTCSAKSRVPLFMGWLHCSLGFSFFCLSIMCIRGSWSQSKCPSVAPLVDVAIAEGYLSAPWEIL